MDRWDRFPTRQNDGTAARSAHGLRLVRDEPDRVNALAPVFASAPRLTHERLAKDSPERAALRAVAQANIEAARNGLLDPRDPRWLVALEVAAKMQGSVLSFERRRAVLKFAAMVGVRPFDANLIIATVQDRARRGEPLSAAVAVVAQTAPARRRRRRGWHYVAAAAIAIAAHLVMAIYLLK